MKQHVLVVDEGSLATKAVLFDRSANVVAQSSQRLRQLYPHPGWVEYDAMEIWRSTELCMRRALQDAGLSLNDIAAVGITNQRGTAVVWDRATGSPAHNAIFWGDIRTLPIVEELQQHGVDALVQQRNGLVLTPLYSAAKVRWILDHTPGLRERADAGALLFGTIESWLVWNLTRGESYVQDYANAQRTMIFNIHSWTWDDDLLAAFGIPRQMLPHPGPAMQLHGVARLQGLPGAAPIYAVTGDQTAALFAHGCFSAGEAKCSYGTSTMPHVFVGPEPRGLRGGLVTVAYTPDGKPGFAMGALAGGTDVIEWLEDGLGILQQAGAVEELARQVPDNGGVYFVPAFAGLGAPHWDPYARGTMLGITRGTNRAHIARAAIESIAFQVKDLLASLQLDAGVSVHSIRVDGGAAKNDLLLQFQADLLETPIERPGSTEVAALGAAHMAGVACGLWSVEELQAARTPERVFTPVADQTAQALYAEWRRAVERARGWMG